MVKFASPITFRYKMKDAVFTRLDMVREALLLAEIVQVSKTVANLKKKK